MKKSLASVLVLLGLIAYAGVAGAEGRKFPHRAKYKHVPIMEAETLRGQLEQVVLVDVRSRQYPEASVLLGRSPISSSDLIGKDRYKARVISAADFEARVEQGNAIVLDIRDLRQRDVALFPFKEERATLDDGAKIAEVVAKAKKADKPLLIYDKVGKQAPWFQYYLEREGVKNYCFMEGGAEGYHEAKFG